MSGLWIDVIRPRKRRSVRREMEEVRKMDGVELYDGKGSREVLMVIESKGGSNKGSTVKSDDVSLGLLLSQVATNNIPDSGEKAILPFKKRKYFIEMDGDGKGNGEEEQRHQQIEGEEEEVTSILQSDSLGSVVISEKSTTIGQCYRWNEKEECEIAMETIKTIPSSSVCEEEKEKIEKKRAIHITYSHTTTTRSNNRKLEVEDGSRTQLPAEEEEEEEEEEELYTIVKKRCDGNDRVREKEQDEAVKETKIRRRRKRKYRTFESLYRSATQVMNYDNHLFLPSSSSSSSASISWGLFQSTELSNVR